MRSENRRMIGHSTVMVEEYFLPKRDISMLIVLVKLEYWCDLQIESFIDFNREVDCAYVPLEDNFAKDMYDQYHQQISSTNRRVALA